MRADRVLAENIAYLLRVRHQTQKSLATYCRHSEKWLSQILATERQLRTVDFDRVADFFGIATYQLLQPGISPLGERRKKERRSGQERRIGHTHREMLQVRDEIDRARPPRGRRSSAADED